MVKSDSGILGREKHMQMSEGEREERECKHVGLELRWQPGRRRPAWLWEGSEPWRPMGFLKSAGSLRLDQEASKVRVGLTGYWRSLYVSWMHGQR